MSIEDFEFQLRAQQQSAAEKSENSASLKTYVDPTDGTVYEWDSEKQGWFPKVDEDFLAAYQAGYGVSDATTTSTEVREKYNSCLLLVSFPDPLCKGGEGLAKLTTTSTEVPSEVQSEGGGDGKKKNGEETNKEPASEASRKRKAEPSKGWFDIDDAHNHNVYVSGLPLDMTLEEFTDQMTKYGIIMDDEKGEPKIRLYTDANGEPKGDGRCCYLKIESVNLALELLDGRLIRDHTIHVERAKFQMKGEYNPTLKKKKKNKKKGGGQQEKLLDWRERKPDGPKRNKYDKIIIFKHLFNPKEFEDEPMLINEIRDDLREECEKFGVVKKILLFDRHPAGVASVAFKEFESADTCVLKMNGRWYGGKQLEVTCWDGLTNYQVEETDQEREQRLKIWENFLEAGTAEDQMSPK